MKNQKLYTSSMKIHVRYFIYSPKVILRIKGVVQIHHGLGENADRYEHFAKYLCENGYVVVVSDFVGHGQSLIDFEQGYFGESDGPKNLVKDVFHLYEIVRRRYDDVPFFMLGVDLGSVLIRKFLSVYPDFIDGAILIGTPSSVENSFYKKTYLGLKKIFKGPIHKDFIYFKNLNKSFNRNLRTKRNIHWQTSDQKERAKFLKDPMNHFAYTVQGYRDMISLIEDVNSLETIQKTPSYISLCFMEGSNDPLVHETRELVKKYKNVLDVTYQSFDNLRHAILFEQNKKEVYKSILEWLENRTYL